MQQVNAFKKCLVLTLLLVYGSLTGLANTGRPALKYKAVEPVYARLEVSLTDNDNWTTSTEKWYSQLVEVKIVYYSDAACTTPITLPRNINWTIKACGYFETNSSYQSNCSTTPEMISGSASMGQSESYLDNIMPWEGSWYYRENEFFEWELLEKWRDDYTLVSVDNGAIIATALVPQHSPGF